MGDTDIDESVLEEHDEAPHGHGHQQEQEPEHGEPKLLPSKRRKPHADSAASSTILPRDEDHAKMESLQVSDVSSDTSGSVPSSPQHIMASRFDVEDDFLEQVTACAWDSCPAGDLGNMDELVKHIHDVHIQDLQATGVYTCEWIGCSRKGKKHASGYALKAHMRSHTREKPFYCYLPECDRSFTRSDALAKHMRTVHETEALRPSDPVPKSMQPGGGQPGPNYATAPSLGTPSNGTSKRLKIIIKNQPHSSLTMGGPSSAGGGSADDSVATDDEHHQAATDDEWQFTPLTTEAGFSVRELEMASNNLERLHKICRAQLHWSTEEGEQLRAECAEWEEKYWREWRAKELLMEQIVQAEKDWDKRRQAVLAGEADAQLAAAASATIGGSGKDGSITKCLASVPPLLELSRPVGGLVHPQTAAAMASSKTATPVVVDDDGDKDMRDV